MKTVLLLLGLVLGLYGLICLLMYRFQEVLIFPGYSLPAEYVFRFPFDPPPEEVWWEQADARIHGLYFSPAQASGVVLYFHGNGGALDDWGEVVPRFTERGLAVLLIDYRGYGKSRGERTEAALLADAVEAYDWLAEQWQADQIRVYGRSLGSGIAAYVAAERPAHSLLLETPYAQLSQVAQDRYPWLPVLRLIRFHFPTYQYLPEVSAPVFLIHGTNDQVIPVSHSQRLIGQFPQHTYLEIPGGTHNDLDQFPAYAEWLDSALFPGK